ncbi:Sm-like protein LSM8 [Galdieria sulphuraria]|uniref:U6 snRNA-associated Sm-like protein LSm8 n=1 Tax=Galdieria sulphuraria TaxID=130081 RepID=M2XP62_GALSU|nr:U6 snRNA-associated Sm-like protein LSm8 [Galdieria sulphuraria]EME31962.1 U6 snRNA-associated Sm-like protein LSm8 [Galdieria sulphuraria]GJD06739.1 Sm-like protein LSM8 [Galdieria sulphuraria]GJD09821.1 Sm-like protein LSM8 [Galdieria sulphuraria]|eukprot:XP_005708482.1 U6 snRNA-associated Sm-like protein LSm8 [Galdieria sulphuraria]
MSLLSSYVDKTVSVVTNDGRILIGILKGFDQSCNVILESTVERIFGTDVAMQEVAVGLYVLRGDDIAILGELDAEKESETDFQQIQAAPLRPVVH